MNYFIESPVLLVSYVGALIWILALYVRFRSVRKDHERERERWSRREQKSKDQARRTAKLAVLSDMYIAGVLTETAWLSLSLTVIADPLARLDFQPDAKCQKLRDKATTSARPVVSTSPAPLLEGSDAFMSWRIHQGGAHDAPSNQYKVPVYTINGGDLSSSCDSVSDCSTGG